MRYPAEETAEKHVRILDHAARLFRERGFSGVSVNEIMKATGLTHGPFYNHFASKDALMAESVGHASRQSLDALDAVAPTRDGKTGYIENYLSAAHRDCPGQGCITAALAAETSREPSVKVTMTAHIRAFLETMSRNFPWTSEQTARREAIQAMAAMVGAIVMARAVDDPAFAEEILRDVRAQFSPETKHS